MNQPQREGEIEKILMNYIRLTNLRGKEKPLVRRGLRNEAIKQILELFRKEISSLIREERKKVVCNCMCKGCQLHEED